MQNTQDASDTGSNWSNISWVPDARGVFSEPEMGLSYSPKELDDTGSPDLHLKVDILSLWKGFFLKFVHRTASQMQQFFSLTPFPDLFPS